MQNTGIGTSLMLVAIGAILAFAVNFVTSGIDINTIGVILMVVGLIGLLLSFGVLGGFGSWGHSDTTATIYRERTAPHDHMIKDTYVDGPETVSRVEREERVTRR